MGKEKRMLNASILAISEEELLQNLHHGVLVTPNIDHLVKLQTDRELYEAFVKAEWVVCDSRVLYFLYRFTRNRVPINIPGSSFFTKYYLHHKGDRDCRIFLLGAMNGRAQMAMQRINERCGRQIVVGAFSPSWGFEDKADENSQIERMIRDCQATVVVVGLGVPKQEKWIMNHKKTLPSVKLWMALGATIDFESGALKRAPRWLQYIGLEWLYRISQEPKRLFRRYFVDDMKFFWHYAKQLLGVYRDPFELSTHHQRTPLGYR